MKLAIKFIFALKKKKNHEKAVFLHIPKTAGTSIVKYVKKHYGRFNVISHGNYVGLKARDLDKFSFISGHFGYEFIKDYIANRYSFTFLREPVDRVLSLYSFARSQKSDQFPIYKLAREMQLDEFIEFGINNELIRSNIWNNQAWQIAHGWGGRGINNFDPDKILETAIENINKFSYVGLVETYDYDIQKILKDLNIEKQTTSNKVYNASKLKLAKEGVSKSTILKIEKLTELDKKLYTYVKSTRS